MQKFFPVNEIFDTVQGEAHWTGAPSLFIRFQGCSVGCPWCDTRYTWETKPENAIPVPEMLAKTQWDSAKFAQVDFSTLATIIRDSKSKHVVLTGGEPAMHDLVELTALISKLSKTAQIETSGTYEIRVNHETWVTLSPKIGMPGGYKVRSDCITLADEIKMPVGKMSDIKTLRDLLEMRYDNEFEVWLQPLSQSKKATEICVDQARINGWKLSMQAHKYLNLR